MKQERDIKDQKISSICWYSLQIGTSWKTADWNFIQVAYLSNEDPNSCAISAAEVGFPGRQETRSLSRKQLFNVGSPGRFTSKVWAPSKAGHFLMHPGRTNHNRLHCVLIRTFPSLSPIPRETPTMYAPSQVFILFTI